MLLPDVTALHTFDQNVHVFETFDHLPLQAIPYIYFYIRRIKKWKSQSFISDI